MASSSDGSARDQLPLQAGRTWLKSTHADGAGTVFSWRPKSLSEMAQTAHIALDTNVLLVPYRTGTNSLAAIEHAYRDLAKQGRLMIPGQVAREFARNRVARVGELRQQVLDLKSRIKVERLPSYPLLESLSSLDETQRAWEELAPALEAYKKSLLTIASDLESWAGGDPVMGMYASIFIDEIVIDPAFDEKDFRAELEHRQKEKVPPGYKDSNKPDGGFGDLLIWLTILKQMAGSRTDLLFVTGEEKADWWDRTGGAAFYPRYELVDEYRSISNGGTLALVSLSDLLGLMQVDQKVIEDVRQSEDAEGDWIENDEAVRVEDGTFLLVRGPLGNAAVRPSIQSGADDGSAIIYEAWYNGDSTTNPEAFKHGSPYVKMTREFGSSEPVIEAGPYRIPWSVNEAGAGWFYYYNPLTLGDAPHYELALSKAKDITLIDVESAWFSMGPHLSRLRHPSRYNRYIHQKSRWAK